MRVLGTVQAANAPAAPSAKPVGIGQRILDAGTTVANALGLGGAADTIGSNLATLAHPVLANKGYIDQPTLGQNVGAGLSIGSALASVAAPSPASVARTAGEFALLSGAGAAGSDLSAKKDAATTLRDTATSAGIGAAAGGTFKLLGKALAKGGPAALSFTSGVPTDAIKQAADNPAVAKEGLGTTVEKIRNQAVGSLQSLYSDLGNEFGNGLDHINQTVPVSPTADAIPARILTSARDITNQFKIGTRATSDGLVADFSKSAIVKSGEEGAVQKTLDTLSSWSDFSPKGMQDLEARIGALRNFDSNGTSRSSAVVGKIYNSINDVIKTHYPQLAELRTQFSQNKATLDEISNVLSATKDSPTSIQASITRLGNIFKTDREQYVNIIKQLGDRSGVDYLSLLAGTEFQKVLPGFVRGLGGGGAVSVGASFLNPYLLLLAPLFSPRAAGVITRSAPGIAKTAVPIIRAATTQAIPQANKALESQ